MLKKKAKKKESYEERIYDKYCTELFIPARVKSLKKEWETDLILASVT